MDKHPAPSETWHAFVDETGEPGGFAYKQLAPLATPGINNGCSRIFAMVAAVFPAAEMRAADEAWRRVPHAVGQGREVHWKENAAHTRRRFIARSLPEVPGLAIVSVIVAKPFATYPDHLTTYRETLRLLLGRLALFIADRDAVVYPTIAQIKGIPPPLVGEWIAQMRTDAGEYDPAWARLKAHKIDRPGNDNRHLQIADSAAGVINAAFNPDDFGLTYKGYLEEALPAFWHREGSVSNGGLWIEPRAVRVLHEFTWFTDLAA